MYCQKCGANIPDDAVVCTGCGRAVANAKLTPDSDNAALSILIPIGRSGLAIAAGYAAFAAMLVLPAPIALLLGILAIKDLKKHPDKKGMGRAIFGLVTGFIGTLILVFILISKTT